MFNTRTRACEDRIVGLQQSHVRPINREKRSVATECGQKLHLSVVYGCTFLEQTGWSNFNEGRDLQCAVEDYYRRFDVYPETGLVDHIYQTRANRSYCQELGICLTGSALGRKKAGSEAKEQRQMYQDSCVCNAVEGRNGNLKRRFGLDLVFWRQCENAKTEAALNILAINAAYRLCRWLMRFLGCCGLKVVFQ